MKASMLLRSWALNRPMGSLMRPGEGFAPRRLSVRNGRADDAFHRPTWGAGVSLYSHGELAAVRLNPVEADGMPVFLMADGPSPYLAPVRYRNIRKVIASVPVARLYFLPFSAWGNRRQGADAVTPRDCRSLAVEAGLRRLPNDTAERRAARSFAFVYPEGFERLARRMAEKVAAPDEDHRAMLAAALRLELAKTS